MADDPSNLSPIILPYGRETPRSALSRPVDRTGFGLGFMLTALATFTGAVIGGPAGHAMLGIAVASVTLIVAGLFLGTAVGRWGFVLGILS